MQITLSKEEQKNRVQTIKEQKEILTTQQQITCEITNQRRLSLQSMDIFKPQYSNISNRTLQISYDVFISHASEDKENFVRPFATWLKNKELKVWYDEFELKFPPVRLPSGFCGKAKYGLIRLTH